MAVTGDSPEKQRVGIIAHCHGAADQAWSAAAVAAACAKCEAEPSRIVELVREDSLQATGRDRDMKSAVGLSPPRNRL